MLVHTITPTESNPLQGAPATEQTGVDPDDFASSAVSVPFCSGATSGAEHGDHGRPVRRLVGHRPLHECDRHRRGRRCVLASSSTRPRRRTPPHPTSSTARESHSNSLTGCITNNSSGISVQTNDLVEQVIGVVNSDLAGAAEADSPVTDSLECHTSGSPVPVSSTSGTTFMPCDVPAGPNTTNGDGGLAGFVLYADPTSSNGNFVASGAVHRRGRLHHGRPEQRRPDAPLHRRQGRVLHRARTSRSRRRSRTARPGRRVRRSKCRSVTP